MASFGSSDDLRGATFRDVSLRDASFRGVSLRDARISDADLSHAVLRGVQVEGIEIDGPWLFDGDEPVLVNGVDIRPYVDAELNTRFPGRELRGADTPDGLRAAWVAVQGAWAAVFARVATFPAGIVDRSVDGEWPFVRTLRHLVMATDVWLGRAILGGEHPYHPLGVPNDEPGTEAYSAEAFDAAATPSYDEVLAVRAGRVAMVGDYLATVTPEVLAEHRPNPHAPEYDETVLHCLHTILDEEWEHLRYAVRDLDALSAEATSG
ncbi:DinB family protein [Flexivirga caeni]|uniref:DinB family protein n=1 Tax=Flexivirga caeni TaxID=2294115 RepID=A0A3M9LV72_9MICO|nr:DinB family protein [Flexivirga caeni]RNI17226.1 DinB family protein [Flexivirga caeni]